MTRACVALLLLYVVSGLSRIHAEQSESASFSGRWTLNRELSEFPKEIGFGVDWLPPPASDGAPGASQGGRGRRGSAGGGAARAGAFPTIRESPDDAKRLRLLTAEVRTPPVHLTIAETPAAVTITNEGAAARTFRADAKDTLQLEGVPVGFTSKREGGHLIVTYHVEDGRDLRYSYWIANTTNPPRLTVDVQFLERGGGGDSVRRVYEPTTVLETMAATALAPAKPSSVPAVPGTAGVAGIPGIDDTPGAELKGLENLGILVEDLSSQATACGLNHDTIETALAKRLSDAGFNVRRNSDEDTYVYVNIMTNSVSTGVCVSRYDTFLYTHTTATLSYQQRPVLVQVSLMHRGGIVGGAPSTHGAAVLQGLQNYVDLFSTQIRNANK